MIRRILKYLFITVASTILLFLVLATLLYCPPIQDYAVERTTRVLSEKTGIDFRIERLRLSFPLNLSLQNAIAIEEGDTLLDARSLLLEIKLLPLLKGRADIEGFAINSAKVDTKSYIPDTRIKGSLKKLSASSHGVEWSKELAHINHVLLDGGDIYIALSDTAAPDTLTTVVNWQIILDDAEISTSKVVLSMPGDSMRIGAYIGKAGLSDGDFNLGDLSYGAKSINFKNSSVTYDLPLEEPTTEGFDANHIVLDEIYLAMKDVMFHENTSLRANLQELSAKEKCGFIVNNISGDVYADTTRLEVPAFSLHTPHSLVKAGISAQWAAFMNSGKGYFDINIDANIGHQDVTTLAKGFIDRDIIAAYPNKNLTAQASASGNINNFTVNGFSVRAPGIFSLSAEGKGENVMDKARRGKAKFNLHTGNLAFVRKLLPAIDGQTFYLPDSISAQGYAAVNGNAMEANTSLNIGKGCLQAKATGNLKKESYNIAVHSYDIPVGTLLPGSGMGDFTGSLEADGAGFDIFNKHTTLTAKANVKSFAYDNWDLDSISLDAKLNNQHAVINFSSFNPLLEAKGKMHATLVNRIVVFLDTRINRLDLQALSGAKDTIAMGTNVHIDAYAEKDMSTYGMGGSLENIYFFSPKRSFTSRDINFSFNNTPDKSGGSINAGDLHLELHAQSSIDTLISQLSAFTDGVIDNIDKKHIDQDSLKQLLPNMGFNMRAGKDNAISNILRYWGYQYNSVSLELETNPKDGMNGNFNMAAFQSGTLLLDAIKFNLQQDSTRLNLDGNIRNYTKHNHNKFEATLNAHLLSKGGGVLMKFANEWGRVGINIGLEAELKDEGLKLKLLPENPILAFRTFTINKDNYILLRKDSTLFADVDLLADDGTGLKIYSLPGDSINDVTLSINRINLGELSNFLPYMPQITGFLNGDLHFMRNTINHEVSAMAMVATQDLKFEDIVLGNIGADVTYVPKDSGEHYASAFVTTDDIDVMECSGTYYNDKDGYFEGTASLHEFPLKLINSFLAGTDIALDGNANGNFSVHGTLDKPEMNGMVNFNSAHVFSDVYGFKFLMDEDDVLLKSNLLTFKDFDLTTTGKQPLRINGTVDLNEGIVFNVNMLARNFELINTKKTSKSMVYGKVFTDFDGSIRGTAENLSIRGNLSILNRTDVTYILKDSPLSDDNSLKDLVQFVDFTDTARHEVQNISTTGIDLKLAIDISDAARFHCLLSEDGKNYVDLEGGGSLVMQLTQQGDMRLTGRFTTNSGEMKYALPVIPLKTFTLTPGSYVEFTGDLLNPTLSITAKERVKASVTENDMPRSVAFDVGIALSQPLKNMGLKFTIEAPEDLSVQNQLAAMTEGQRSKTAVAMLATGMYITDENASNSSSTGGFKATNALNAFLQSEIQNIAGTALKTIDVSLGIENNTTTTGATTTDYSFQFSKRFWGDRISVIVGGKVSTGAEAEYSAESFINNIAVEYRLDKGASRYVRVFYDRTQQDAFEGQITQGGIGLVLRRKSDRLGELFIFRNPKKNKEQKHDTE